jgi:hypothetical protein
MSFSSSLDFASFSTARVTTVFKFFILADIAKFLADDHKTSSTAISNIDFSALGLFR